MNLGHPVSYLEWFVSAMGSLGLLAMLLGLALLVVSSVVVAKSRRPATIAACLPLTIVPFTLTLYSVLSGTASSFEVITLSQTELKQYEICGGLAESLALLQCGLLASAPAFLVLAVGLLARAIGADRRAAA